MDDWIVLATTRRHLRRAVRITHQILEALKLRTHPDKTFIGRIERGFDFLGYLLCPGALQPAHSTLDNFFANVARLYERNLSAPRKAKQMGDYVRNWLAWLLGGWGACLSWE